MTDNIPTFRASWLVDNIETPLYYHRLAMECVSDPTEGDGPVAFTILRNWHSIPVMHLWASSRVPVEWASDPGQSIFSKEPLIIAMKGAELKETRLFDNSELYYAAMPWTFGGLI